MNGTDNTEPEQQAYTAARIAHCLGKTPQAVRKQLRDIRPDSLQIVAGNEAAVWSFARLPESTRLALTEAATGLHYRTAEAMLANPPMRWEPPLPLDKIDQDEIDQAAKLRAALKPWLAQQHDLGLSSGDMEARGVEDYARLFGHRISTRYWRELFTRTLRRDAGAEDWNRLEIYLPASPKAKEQVSNIISAALAQEFGELDSFIASFSDQAKPTKIQKQAVWTLALGRYASMVESGISAKQSARRVRSFLAAKAPFLAASRHALLMAFTRKLADLEKNKGDAKALRDGREHNGARFDLPDEDRDLLIYRAGDYYGGDVAPAWRDCLKKGFSEEVRNRYAGKSAEKSHVPTSVMHLVSFHAKVRAVINRGKRAFDAFRGYVDRDYDDPRIPSLKCMTADDFTMPVYFYVPDGKGWFTLTRGQILIFTDFRTLRVLGWSMQPDRNYSSLTIRSLCTHVFAEHGVPAVLYFEHGIWKSSTLLKGRIPPPFEFSEVIHGLHEFGIKFMHCDTPRAKTVERVGGLLQDLMEAEPGYCGRNERIDGPESLRKQMAKVEARKVHPSRYFYSYEQWQKRFGEIVDQYNATPRGGKMLRGVSPDEGLVKFADANDPPMQFSAGLRYLLAHDKREIRVKLDGITFFIGKQRFNYRGREISHLVGHKVLSWFDPEHPETLVVTDMQRKNPICVARSKQVSALECLTDPGSGRLATEMRRIEDQLSYTKARYIAVKSKFPMPQRRALAEANTLRLGEEIEQKKTARKDRTVRVDRARRQAGRIGMPAVLVDDDPDSQRGLEMMAEAERESRGHGGEPAAVHTYQLDPNKTFKPKTTTERNHDDASR